MGKDRFALIILCIVFLVTDILVFEKTYHGNIEKERQVKCYNDALLLYEQSSPKYDKEGLELSKAGFESINGYGDSDSYVDIIDDEIDSIRRYEDALSAYNSKEYESAYVLFSSLFVSGYRDVEEQVNKMSDEILIQANDFLRQREYDMALSCLEVIPSYVEEPYAEGLVLAQLIVSTKEEEEKNTKYQDAITLFERKEYKDAQTLFLSLGNFKKTSEYLEKIGRKCYNRSVALLEKGAFGDAYKSTEYIYEDGTWSGYKKTSRLRNEIKDKCIEKALDDAQTEYLNSHDIDTVVSILTAAEKEVGKDERITTEVRSYKNAIVNLSDMEIFSYSLNDDIYGDVSVNKYLQSNYDVTYKTSLSCSGGYVGYLLDGKGYSLFKSVLGCPKGFQSDGFRHGASLSVIGKKGDTESVLYTSEEITSESKPIDLEVKIDGYEVVYLEWRCFGGNLWNNWAEYATLFEPKFIK